MLGQIFNIYMAYLSPCSNYNIAYCEKNIFNTTTHVRVLYYTYLGMKLDIDLMQSMS